jgi:hypothetical protein
MSYTLLNSLFLTTHIKNKEKFNELNFDIKKKLIHNLNK